MFLILSSYSHHTTELLEMNYLSLLCCTYVYVPYLHKPNMDITHSPFYAAKMHDPCKVHEEDISQSILSRYLRSPLHRPYARDPWESERLSSNFESAHWFSSKAHLRPGTRLAFQMHHGYLVLLCIDLRHVIFDLV